jgi:hypothetical protein
MIGYKQVLATSLVVRYLPNALIFHSKCLIFHPKASNTLSAIANKKPIKILLETWPFLSCLAERVADQRISISEFCGAMSIHQLAI